jgi:hypothetical protein
MMCAVVGLCECGLTSLTVLSDEADTTVDAKSRKVGAKLSFRIFDFRVL